MVWKEDTQNFYENEKNKSSYLKDVYKQHESILKEQMKDKEEKQVQEWISIKVETAAWRPHCGPRGLKV